MTDPDLPHAAISAPCAPEIGRMSPVAVLFVIAAVDSVVLGTSRLAGFSWTASLSFSLIGGAVLSVLGFIAAALITEWAENRARARANDPTGDPENPTVSFVARRRLRDLIREWTLDRDADQAAQTVQDTEPGPARQIKRRA